MPRHAKPIAKVKVPTPFVLHDPIPEELPPRPNSGGRPQKSDPMLPVLEKIKLLGVGVWCRVAEHPNAGQMISRLHKKYKDFEFSARTKVVGVDQGDIVKVVSLYARFIDPPDVPIEAPTKVPPPFLPDESDDDDLRRLSDES